MIRNALAARNDEAWGLGKTFLKFIIAVKRAETFALSKKTPAMLQSDILVPAEDNLRRFSLISFTMFVVNVSLC